MRKQRHSDLTKVTQLVNGGARMRTKRGSQEGHRGADLQGHHALKSLSSWGDQIATSLGGQDMKTGGQLGSCLLREAGWQERSWQSCESVLFSRLICR